MKEKEIITGPAGCGSTRIILERIAKRINEGNAGDILIVVTNSKFLERIEMILLNDYGFGGLSHDMFKTPNDLVYHFDLHIRSRIISRDLMNMLLRKVLLKSGSGLEREGYQIGFRRRLGLLFHEFRSIHLSEREKLLTLLENKYHDGASGKGLLAKIVKAFKELEREIEQRGLISIESALFSTADRVSRSDYEGFLYVIGFDDLENPQLAVITEMVKKSREALINLPGGDDWSFSQTEKLKKHLIGIGCSETILPKCKRFSRKSLEKLENDFKTGKIVDDFDGISLVLLDGIRDESDYISRVVASKLNDGRTPNDILIIHPHPEKVFNRYNFAFERIGIPFRSGISFSLKEISPARDLLAFLWLIAGDTSYRSVISISRFMRRMTELVNVSDTKSIEELIEGEKTECPSGVDPKSWTLFASLVNRSKEIKHIDEFIEFIETAIKNVIEMPLKMPIDQSRMVTSSWFKLHAILDQMRMVREVDEDGYEGTYADFMEEFSGEVGQTRIQAKDRRLSAVTMVGLDDARLEEKSIVILAGMNDVNYPPKAFSDPIMGETIREELVKLGYRFKTASEEQDRNRYLLYSALTRAKDELIITCPSIDERGEELAISPALAENIPNGWARADEQRPIYIWDDLVTESSLNFESISKKSESLDKFKSIYQYGFDILTQSDPLSIEPLKDVTPPIDLTGKIYSASNISGYERCPFYYLASSVLKLKEAQTGIEKVISALDRGTAIHEYLARRLGSNEEVNIEDIFKELRIDLGELDFVEEGSLLNILVSARELVEEELENIEQKVYEILHAEFPFGMMGKEPVTLDLAIGERMFRGKIDRIDQYPDGSIAVYDYKTTSGVKRVKSIYDDACAIQIPLYMSALSMLGIKPSKIGVIAIGNDGFAKYPEEQSEKMRDELNKVLEEGKATISRIIEAIESLDFKAEPSKKEYCGWDKCGYYHVCRIDR